MRNRLGYKRLCAALMAALCFGFAFAEAEISSTRMKWVEQTLYSMGYHTEESNSLLDDETRSALRSFQKVNGLNQTGEPDDSTLLLLESGEGITCHDYLLALSREYAELPLLQTGSSGDSVVWLQKSLKAFGYFSGSCDGVFGEATQAAVCRFQRANGLTETGIADSSVQMRLSGGEVFTWSDFIESGSAVVGDSGVHVRRIQRQLAELGYYSGAENGSFGERLERAVRLFQSANGLETTGEVDSETSRVLQSGQAAAYRDPATLNRGDVGEEVTALQNRLSALGYFDNSITGSFGITTETAVRLFQMGNGLPPTGEADAATLSRAYGADAVALSVVRESFLEQVRNQPESVGTMLADLAVSLRGQPFGAYDDDLFRGFSFVQYVCVASGIPVVAPEDLTAMVDEPVARNEMPGRGDILVFRMDDVDGQWMLLAISTGDGRAAYASFGKEYVLESSIRSLYGADLYKWKMGTRNE